MEIRFKNAINSILYVSILASACIFLSAGICIFVTCIWEEGKDLVLCLLIFGCILLTIWIITIIIVISTKTVIISSDNIKLTRGKKIYWCLSKEDIDECLYNKMKWYYFLFPIATINAFALQFKLKNGKISRHYCSLSQRQIDKIKSSFDYPFKEIQTIYEQ